MIEFPTHAASMSLEHNHHKSGYQTVEEYLKSPANEDLFDWESPEHKQRAIDTNEIWVLQWYPITPIGFNCVAAPTLGECLSFARKVAAKP